MPNGSESRKNYYLVVIAALISFAILMAGVGVAYRIALEQNRFHLREIAQSQARLIEAVAAFDKTYSGTDNPGGAFGATLSQLQQAHKNYKGFGETGEFTFAMKENDSVVFLLPHRHEDAFGTSDAHAPVPFGSPYAQPMQLALEGRSGTVIATDYRGETVLAAYEPVRWPDKTVGIVTKIDMSEIRTPFINATFISAFFALAISVLALLLLTSFGAPLPARKEADGGGPDAIRPWIESADTKTPFTVIAICLVVAALIFLLDISMELGVAGGVPYVALVIFAMRSPRSRFILLTASMATLLIILGYIFSPPGGVLWVVLANRLMALMVIWVTAFLAVQYKRSENALKKSRDELELRVQERTEELVNANRELMNEISEKIRVEERLKIMALFPEQNPGPVIRCDRHGTVKLANPAARDVLELVDPEGLSVQSIIPALSLGDVQRCIDDNSHLLHTDVVNGRTFQFAVIGSRETQVAYLYGSDITARVAAEKAHAEKSAYLDSILLSSTELAIAATDLDFRITYYNPAAERLFGYTSPDVIGKTVIEIHTKEKVDHARFERAIEIVKREGEYRYRVEMESRNGVRHIDSRVSGIWDRHRNLIGFVLMSRDITDRIMWETRLIESEEKYRALMNDSSIAILLADTDGNLVEANRAAEELFGYSRDEILTMHTRDLHPPNELDRAASTFRQIMQTGSGNVSDYMLLRKDGTRIVTDASVSVFTYGQKTMVQASFLDITERKRAEETLRTLNNAIEQAADMVVIMDAGGRIEYLNPAFEKTMGYAKEELIGKTSDAFHLDGHEGTVSREMLDTALDGDVWHGEVVGRNKAGGTVSILMTLSPVISEGRAITHFVAIMRDIREEKALRQQLIQAEKLSSLGTFVSGIAHELNNPLTAILGFSRDVAETTGLPEEVRRKVQIVAEQSERTVNIVNNLLKFSRKHIPEIKAVDVHRIIDETLKLHSYSMRTDNIMIVKHYDAEAPFVRVDAHQVQQVFLNIVLNAYHAMKKAHGKGMLTVSTASLPDEVMITLENDGPPIPEDQLKKIFDPFFTTKEVGQGTGLGLNIAYGIVRDHNGRIWVENVGTHGVRFNIALMRADGEELREVPLERETSIAGKRVLFVDDEEAICKWMSVVLLKAGVFAQIAANGEEAIPYLEEADFDVILTDIKMPKMGGFELARWIFDNKPHLSKKVVLATGAIDGKVDEFCDIHGCSFLLKPYKREAVLEQIRSVTDDTVSTGENGDG